MNREQISNRGFYMLLQVRYDKKKFKDFISKHLSTMDRSLNSLRSTT